MGIVHQHSTIKRKKKRKFNIWYIDLIYLGKNNSKNDTNTLKKKILTLRGEKTNDK